MKHKILIACISILLLSACSGGNVTSDKNVNKSVTFTEDVSANRGNPDRGFYDADYPLNLHNDGNIFTDAKKRGFTLVYAPIDLEAYISTATLPQTLLNNIDSNLKNAQTAGVKVIFRIKYRSSLNGNDPSKEIIMGHLDQLSPLLKAHKNSISVVQAGVIGAWGEWHTFTGDYAKSNSNYKQNRRDIIGKLSTIFPEKYIQLRTPMHKELLYGSSKEYADKSNVAKITPEIAFGSTLKSRLGYHNDCFLADESDMGTYASQEIEFWKSYVQNDTKYAPIGGETCKDTPAFTTCTQAIIALKKFRYSYINDAYHPDVILRWKEEGCYQEISDNIGYRLLAKRLNVAQNSHELTLSLSLQNKGYAAPYMQSDVSFVLKNSTKEYRFKLAVDTRRFAPQETQILESTISLSTMESGKYCLYLQIGQNTSAIKLSNSNIWEKESLLNKLMCGIVVP